MFSDLGADFLRWINSFAKKKDDDFFSVWTFLSAFICRTKTVWRELFSDNVDCVFTLTPFLRRYHEEDIFVPNLFSLYFLWSSFFKVVNILYGFQNWVSHFEQKHSITNNCMNKHWQFNDDLDSCLCTYFYFHLTTIVLPFQNRIFALNIDSFNIKGCVIVKHCPSSSASFCPPPASRSTLSAMTSRPQRPQSGSTVKAKPTRKRWMTSAGCWNGWRLRWRAAVRACALRTPTGGSWTWPSGWGRQWRRGREITWRYFGSILLEIRLQIS